MTKKLHRCFVYVYIIPKIEPNVKRYSYTFHKNSVIFFRESYAKHTLRHAFVGFRDDSAALFCSREPPNRYKTAKIAKICRADQIFSQLFPLRMKCIGKTTEGCHITIYQYSRNDTEKIPVERTIEELVTSFKSGYGNIFSTISVKFLKFRENTLKNRETAYQFR